jgi:spore maturation protein B
VGVLAVAGSKQPSAIIGSAIMATICSTIAGVAAVKLFEKLPAYRLPPFAGSKGEADRSSATNESLSSGGIPAPTIAANSTPLDWRAKLCLMLFTAIVVDCFLLVAFPEICGFTPSRELAKQGGFLRTLNSISLLSIPFLLSFFPLYAALRRVKVYEEFVEGAKEGFQTSMMIIPYLVAILVAIGMFREAGGIRMVSDALQPALDLVRFPTELLPLCLVRPLSGSGTLGLFSDIVKEFGPDSLLARTAGTIYGSTETTFYVIAVYFGAVNIRRTRHAVPAGLIADAVGIVASIIICKMMFGG